MEYAAVLHDNTPGVYCLLVVSNQNGQIEFQNIRKKNVKQWLFIYDMLLAKIFLIVSLFITPFQQSKKVRAIPCQRPPELVNWNFLTMKQFFTKYFLRPWNSYLQKKKSSIIFMNCGIFLCLQKN